MKGSPRDNVWYGQTNFVRIRRYEPLAHYIRPLTDPIDLEWGGAAMHCGSIRSVGSVGSFKKLKNFQLFRQRRIRHQIRTRMLGLGWRMPLQRLLPHPSATPSVIRWRTVQWARGPSTDLIDSAWGASEMHCGSVHPFGSVACVKKLRNVQLFRQRRIHRPIRSSYATGSILQ